MAASQDGGLLAIAGRGYRAWMDRGAPTTRTGAIDQSRTAPNARRSELPMAVADCALSQAEFNEQADRYRRLGAAATRVQRKVDRLEIDFASDVDLDLLKRAVAVERECCSFLTVDYDNSTPRLTIASEPGRPDALDAILAAFTAAASQGD